jgi:hypothetical protein
MCDPGRESSMSEFTVDIGGLDALGKNLNRAKENIDGALKAMEDIGPDSVGPDELDDACAEFREDWERGIKKLGECVGKITDALGTAKGKYAEFETALQDNLTKMKHAVESGTAGQPVPPSMVSAPTGGNSR